jgi:hypothetical protein
VRRLLSRAGVQINVAEQQVVAKGYHKQWNRKLE